MNKRKILFQGSHKRFKGLNKVHNSERNVNYVQRNGEHFQARKRAHEGSFGENSNKFRRLWHDGRHSNEPYISQMNIKCSIHLFQLQELVKYDNEDLLTRLCDMNAAWLNNLQSRKNPNMIVLMMHLISNICDSSFDQIKLKLLLDICNSPFIMNLQIYLISLPNEERTDWHWDNETIFWQRFIKFCETVKLISPVTAFKRIRFLIEHNSKVCLEGLKEKHNFELNNEDKMKLANIRNAVTHDEENNDAGPSRGGQRQADEEMQPPQNFRDLSVVPTREDLTSGRPFLRANIVKGGYRDIEDYLDVQFRLLREDCFGPIREGILQYLNDPSQRKYDNVRVFPNVKFVDSYISTQKVGSVVQVDDITKGKFSKIKWSHNKRFLFGSLLLFTKDNGKSFIVATVLDREDGYLSKGKIPISVVNVGDGVELYTDDSYTMIECGVYYEPYFHILKAMQHPSFPQHIAMKKYIVDVNTEPTHPCYIHEDTVYNIPECSLIKGSFKVLDESTWPTREDLQFNESQYEAYKMALTQEFAIIQGPPGTGKTYLGVEIAKTLLKNISHMKNMQLLFVCYTNHALDQFLEKISKVTSSIVRIGGQSRNKNMDPFNLHVLRKKNQQDSVTRRVYLKKRQNLRDLTLSLQKDQRVIDSTFDSIISYNCLKTYVPECMEFVEHFTTKVDAAGTDPMCHWLYEYLEYDLNESVDSYHPGDLRAKHSSVYDNHINVLLDDFDISLEENKEQPITNAFSTHGANEELKYLIGQYHHSRNAIEKDNLHTQINILKARLRLFYDMREYYFLVHKHQPISVYERHRHISTVDRWMMYFSWNKYVVHRLRKTIKPLQELLETESATYEEIRLMMDIKLIKNIEVIGITTTGAAKSRKLLEALGPSIVIVEEAAEVLEQHIVTTLTKDCKHLILIGDHQQLRPSVSCLRLAKHYNLEVSLFERMVNNGARSVRLGVQHRMRPSIAALVRPHIYADLVDHDSVALFPPVRGVTSDLFFFTHAHREENTEDDSSKINKKEGDLVLGLANYIMQQGYKPEDVTILVAYSSQMFYMRRERSKYVHLSEVKIAVVDNYQGEESKIVLLSLVRNNDENNIGFLGISNRVCVALSRAREGFYIFGNMNMLKTKSKLWLKIAGTLESSGAIGQSLRLKCESHPNEITTITSVEDFEKVAEGGCMLHCEFKLTCNHLCPLKCHGYDKGHESVVCPNKCERILCELSHVCPLMCKDWCGPCKQLVQKELPCKHTKNMFCHLDPDSSQIQCFVKVSAKMPLCGHTIEKYCYEDVNEMKCPVPCELRVESCGHACVLTCHVGDDPEHEQYVCNKPCARRNKNCTATDEEKNSGHHCRKQCHETCGECKVEVVKKRESCKHKERVRCSDSPDTSLCRRKCSRKLDCGHFCTKVCHQICECNEMVVKLIAECGHKPTVECKVEATRNNCSEMCNKMLDCGHPCQQLCKDDCDVKKCCETVPQLFDSPCGHKVNLPCHVVSSLSGQPPEPAVLARHCRVVCGAVLACGHVCAATCARCRRGRLHAPCTRLCLQVNVCGHDCEEPCNQVCPPCNKRCEMQCPHSRCSLPCGALCVPCMEQCSRRCAHTRCSRLCGAVCDAEPCARQCEALQACGHPCRGLCGEQCPAVCAVCRPRDLPLDFLGDPYPDDALFIVLKDCGHIMEYETLDTLMNSKDEAISIPSCPTCRKPIINTLRYKDKVVNLFKKEINPVKARVYGTKKQIGNAKLKLVEKLKALLDNAIYKDKAFADWKRAYEKIFSYSKGRSSLLQINMIYVCIDILEMLSEVYNKFKSANLTKLLDNMVEQNSIICEVIIRNAQKLSEQQQIDIASEIKRMHSMVQLSEIFEDPRYLSNESDDNIQRAAKMANEAILGEGIFNKDIATESLKNLLLALKMSNQITTQERSFIVKAIGAKAGSWYKCPNGHFYNIGNCGGANEVSKCIECKASVGGKSHTLLASNKHAGEIDGSKYPAWPQAANNMANFNLADLL